MDYDIRHFFDDQTIDSVESYWKSYDNGFQYQFDSCNYGSADSLGIGDSHCEQCFDRRTVHMLVDQTIVGMRCRCNSGPDCSIPDC